MQTILLLLLVVAFMVGLAAATVVMDTVVSSLGVAFLAMIAIIALVIAAAGKPKTSSDDAP